MDKMRLVLEYRAMLERWAALRPELCRDESGQQLWWEVELQAEGGNRLPIRIAYPKDYPASPPQIVIQISMPAGTPHLLGGVRMCWYDPRESARNRNIWCPAKDTAAMCLGVAQRWFLAFLVWLTTGEWPVPDARE